MKFHALAVKTLNKGQMITAYIHFNEDGEGFKLAKKSHNATRYADYSEALKTANKMSKELNASVFVLTLGPKGEN